MSSSSTSDFLSDGRSEDGLFAPSSIFDGFRVLLFLFLGFLFREFACLKKKTDVNESQDQTTLTHFNDLRV